MLDTFFNLYIIAMTVIYLPNNLHVTITIKNKEMYGWYIRANPSSGYTLNGVSTPIAGYTTTYER